MKGIVIVLYILFLNNSTMLAIKVRQPSYITYIKTQIKKKDIQILSFDKSIMFNNERDTIVIVPCKIGNSFLLYDLKSNIISFVEIKSSKKIKPDNGMYAMAGDSFQIYSAKRDTTKIVVLDNSFGAYPVKVEYRLKGKLFKSIMIDSPSKKNSLSIFSIPPVVTYQSFETNKSDTVITNLEYYNRNYQHTFINVEWFFNFNGMLPLHNGNAATYKQRFISFTFADKRIIEIEMDNSKNLKAIDLDEALRKF